MIKCTGCGACCRKLKSNIEGATELAKVEGPVQAMYQEIANFPYGYRNDGSCIMLGEDGKCTVYDKRPGVCSASYLFEKYFSAHVSAEWFIKTNATACNNLIQEYGLSDEHLIKQ